MVARLSSKRTRTLELGNPSLLGSSQMQLVLVIHSTGMEPKHTCWIAEGATTMYGILACAIVDEGCKTRFALEAIFNAPRLTLTCLELC